MHREILERDKARADLYACDKCLGDWIAAYRRLEVRLVHECWDKDYWKSLAEIYEPHAKRDIQQMIDETPQ